MYLSKYSEKFLILVSIGMAYVINKPRGVTGLKNYFRELFLKETEQTIDIGVMASDFWIDLPSQYSPCGNESKQEHDERMV